MKGTVSISLWLGGILLAAGLGFSTSSAQIDCSIATEVELGKTYSGDNTFTPNNVTYYSCSDQEESGGEVVYHLTLTALSMFQVNLYPEGGDVDLFILLGCNENACFEFADSSWTVPYPVIWDYYIVVDSHKENTCPFTIEFVDVTPDPLPSACEITNELERGVEVTLAGNTQDSSNYVALLGCATYRENGFEHWYEIVLEPGGHFTASIDFPEQDGALWVLDACENIQDANCLRYADETLSGETEVIAYQNDTGALQTVYLVIDFFWYIWGDYVGILTGDVVSAEPATWGRLKDLYR